MDTRREAEDVNILDISSSSPDESEVTDEMEIPKYPEYCKTMIVKDANGHVKELVFPKALDLDRPKRARTTFSQEQLYKLEDEFQRNQYLVGRERTDLSRRLQLSETQIKVWFQNRRTKYKRDKQKDQDGRATTVVSDNFSNSEMTRLFATENKKPSQTVNLATTTSASKTASPLGPLPSTISHILPYPPPGPLGTSPILHIPPPYPHHMTPPPPHSHAGAHYPFTLASLTSQCAGIYGSKRDYFSQS